MPQICHLIEDIANVSLVCCFVGVCMENMRLVKAHPHARGQVELNLALTLTYVFHRIGVVSRANADHAQGTLLNSIWQSKTGSCASNIIGRAKHYYSKI